ncbi:hypothetical protein A8C32_01500 [Flavivirga aquatica]|uniref:Secretion system C-terminal sorting domain-containing protein n=1 Tax=Flavivirga aquatica TaxID=1849968 RepID=A0A1E5T9W4_9FLAO|nr:hypothetical protein [Flavivirga aquatica]OEK08164.1 hypothetical protein A8C32_01500 [Flavivirga aquatica]
MKIKLIYLLILTMPLLSYKASVKNNEATNKLELLTTQTEFTAGSSIILKFSSHSKSMPTIYISNSYGSTTIKPKLENNILYYSIPEVISLKSGIVTWMLLNNNHSIFGQFNINPKQVVASLETYLGPPSIEAGGTDYSMFVVIPTDPYDNPLKDGTPTTVKHQFLANKSLDLVYSKNLIGYKNIYSEIKTGRILISSECLTKNSKEYTINVLPAIPIDFTISHQRNHDYADGNQITTFYTSIIRDKYGNIVSDGTYVEFFITNTSNNILKTAGTTINGVAAAKMIHPDQGNLWTVKAFINGMAESNEISLSYKQAILDFEVIFSKNNRTITIGPLKSFMNQMIPDGLEVSLSIYKNDKKINTLLKSTFEGYTTFKLSKDVFPHGIYTMNIKTAGLVKTFKNVKL